MTRKGWYAVKQNKWPTNPPTKLQWYYLTHSWCVRTFRKCICPKVKIKLAYNDVTVQYVSNYSSGTR